MIADMPVWDQALLTCAEMAEADASAIRAGVPGVRLPITFSDAALDLGRPSPALGQDDPDSASD